MDVHPVITADETDLAVRNNRWIPQQRNEQFLELKTEVTLEQFGSDADHGVRDVVQGQRFPDDVRIGGEFALPEVVSENDDSFIVLSLRVKSRAARQRHIERLEIVCRNI